MRLAEKKGARERERVRGRIIERESEGGISIYREGSRGNLITRMKYLFRSKCFVADLLVIQL